MPSDDIETRALEAVAGAIGAFESALAGTLEQVRAAVEAHGETGNGKVRDDSIEFGAFAAGRLDAGRFASLLAPTDDIDEPTFDRIRAAQTALAALKERKENLFRVDVPPGGCLRDAVAHALAEIGRAFGAARTVELARAGRFHAAEHEQLVHAFAFDRWSKAERASAPPLLVHVDGADLRAGGLAEFLDGSLKVVLLVRGPAPAAPLATLVRPRTFVLQTEDVAALARLATWDGPGVAALMPEGAARFEHDPEGGAHPWERLKIEFAPAAPKAGVGGYSAAQQAEDLEHLALLGAAPPAPPVPAAAPAAAPASAEPAPPADPADRLAAWLLEQAESEGPR